MPPQPEISLALAGRAWRAGRHSPGLGAVWLIGLRGYVRVLSKKIEQDADPRPKVIVLAEIGGN